MVRQPLRLMTAVGAAAVLLLAACGDDDSGTTAGSGTRTIEIEMRDIEFSPDEVQVEPGETVRFVFRNNGAIRHDAFIGDEAAQDAHGMEMGEADVEDGDMDMSGDGHGDDGGVTVEPGETGELIHTFAEGGSLLIGCHEPGHYEAGMRIMVNVG